jgi:hypothetical protein
VGGQREQTLSQGLGKAPPLACVPAVCQALHGGEEGLGGTGNMAEQLQNTLNRFGPAQLQGEGGAGAGSHSAPSNFVGWGPDHPPA